MTPITSLPLDLLEELRLRRWARENYVGEEARDASWHAVILDEMRQRDAELSVSAAQPAPAREPLVRQPLCVRVPVLDI